MKLFKSLVAVAAAFGAGYLTHQILTEEKKEREEADEVSLLELIEEELANGFDPEEALAEEPAPEAEPVDAPENDEVPAVKDPKFNDAVRLVIETQKAATSLLQRRLGIGYGRAAEMLDRMEKRGYVGAPVGNKPRPVLITLEEFEAKLAEAEA